MLHSLPFYQGRAAGDEFITDVDFAHAGVGLPLACQALQAGVGGLGIDLILRIRAGGVRCMPDQKQAGGEKQVLRHSVSPLELGDSILETSGPSGNRQSGEKYFVKPGASPT